MDSQFDMCGHEAEGAHAPPALPTAVQGTPTPPLCHIWELVTGPEATHWSRLLILDHLDGRARRALFQACRAARDTVLVTANHATLQLDMTQQVSMTTLQAAARALSTRGTLPNKLQLRATEAGQLSYALRALQQGIASVHELSLTVLNDAVTGSVMGMVVRSCPNLRVLSVWANSLELSSRPADRVLSTCANSLQLPGCPAADLLPTLRELSVRVRSASPSDIEGVFRTAGCHLPQLTSLALDWPGMPPPAALPLLLSPDNTGIHLRTLKLDAKLDDALLGLILRCAPAVEELTVDSIWLQTDAHVDTQPQWRQVQSRCLWLSSLVHLPLAPDMQLSNSGDCNQDSYVICDETSVHEAGCAAARLKDKNVRCSVSEHAFVRLCSADDVDVDDEPLALRVAFSLLRTWAVSEPSVTLDGWTVSAHFVAELPGLPPQLTGLQLERSMVWPGDSVVVGSLLRQVPISFTGVSIECDDLTNEQVERLCLGAPENRTAQAPLHITLWGCEVEVLEAIQHRMQLRAAYPNVLLSRED